MRSNIFEIIEDIAMAVAIFLVIAGLMAIEDIALGYL
jgi:hypothetical protein